MLYIALLRGINVGGHVVKMDRLRQLFEEIGLRNVRTYIQSGNVFFETEQEDRAALASTIEQHLGAALGYAVPVMLRTVEEVERVLALDPFGHLDVTDDMRLCIMFMAEPLRHDLALPLRSPKGDMEIVAATEREVFVVWYLINGRPPTSDAWFAKTLGKNAATTRFYHTTAKILAAAKR
jgi:uncharacterized protein (DUF1697 family)